MNIVQHIQNNLIPLEVLQYYNFKCIAENDKTIRACCAIHGGSNPTGFVWNKENNLWFCMTGDCYGGDAFTLVQKMEKCDFITSAYKLANILHLNVDGLTFDVTYDRIIKEQRDWIERQKPRSKEVKEYEIPYTRFYNECNNFHRFDKETLEYYSAKFCKIYPTEEYTLHNKLIIPIVVSGKIYGVALRDTTGKGLPKWMFLPQGLQVRKLLYNIDNIDIEKHKEVILVEGIFDVWAYHAIGIDNVVAIFGSTLKEEQYKEVLKLGLNVTLSFDNDKSGISCTEKTIKKLKNKTSIYCVTLPEGKDPADCTKDELLNSYLKRTKCRSD